MRTQLINTGNMVMEYFKRTMYAIMVIVVAIGIPLLSYLELSYNNGNNKDKNDTEKVQSLASSAMKQHITKLRS